MEKIIDLGEYRLQKEVERTKNFNTKSFDSFSNIYGDIETMKMNTIALMGIFFEGKLHKDVLIMLMRMVQNATFEEGK